MLLYYLYSENKRPPYIIIDHNIELSNSSLQSLQTLHSVCSKICELFHNIQAMLDVVYGAAK